MRSQHLFAVVAVSVLSGGGCKWTDFDDLEGTTWARSTQNPEIGSSDYAVGILGVSSGASGGTLAVVSNDNPSFSTIDYSAKGDADVGANPLELGGTARIGVLSAVPVFATDGTGRIGLVERSTTGNSYSVVIGAATAPAAIDVASPLLPPMPAPDAAVFVPGGDLVFSAANALFSVPAAGGTKVPCAGVFDNVPLATAALGHDASKLWVWTKTGALISFPLASLNCNGITLPIPGVTALVGGFMPAPGARMHVVGGFAILTGHPTTSRSGSIFVVNLTDGTQIGTTATVEGMTASTIAVFGTETYLVVGVPDRAIGGVAAGAVDLLPFNTTTGALGTTPAMSLHDTDPESGQLFGRTVTTMSFNGEPILVVGADSEVFAYYRTALYDHQP